jgi:hypothetical protein
MRKNPKNDEASERFRQVWLEYTKPVLKADARLLASKNIDKSRTVLMDTHSLHVLIHTVLGKTIPSTVVGGGRDVYGPILANAIQSLVLHGCIVVDSLLFQLYPDIWAAYELFPGAVRAVYIDPDIRFKLGQLVDSVTQMYEPSFDAPVGLSVETWTALVGDGIHEKVLMDQIASNIHQDLVPPGYEKDARLDLRARDKVFLPHCVCRSQRTLPRAHFYLELARELGIPLAVDPARSQYFSVLTKSLKNSFRESTPEKMIAKFESMTLEWDIEELHGLVSVDVSIPPVAEYVYRYAQSKRCTLHEAILEVRESRHAVDFREWCARFLSLEDAGRAGAKEQIEMFGELKNVCETWKKDIKEDSVYKSRKLNLEKVPFLGGALKALNMHEGFTIKDPIIRPTKQNSYLLFLNDLLSPIPSR